MGYHAVFSIAIALIILDIILRLAMIDKRTAQRWIPDEPGTVEETERLIGNPGSPQAFSHSETASNSDDHPGHNRVDTAGDPVADSASPKPPAPWLRNKSVPSIVRLACSGSLLVVFQATVVESMVYSAFDTVISVSNIPHAQFRVYIY